MTQNQIKYQQLQEDIRHHKVEEDVNERNLGETIRTHQENESIGWFNAQESVRTHKENESISWFNARSQKAHYERADAIDARLATARESEVTSLNELREAQKLSEEASKLYTEAKTDTEKAQKKYTSEKANTQYWLTQQAEWDYSQRWTEMIRAWIPFLGGDSKSTIGQLIMD